MNPAQPTRPDASSPANQEQILEALSGVLAGQRQRAQQGDVRGTQELITEAEGLLRDLAGAGALTPQSAGRLAEIVRVHRQVELTLAAARRQIIERLAKLRRGRGALHGYGGK